MMECFYFPFKSVVTLNANYTRCTCPFISSVLHTQNIVERFILNLSNFKGSPLMGIFQFFTYSMLITWPDNWFDSIIAIIIWFSNPSPSSGILIMSLSSTEIITMITIRKRIRIESANAKMHNSDKFSDSMMNQICQTTNWLILFMNDFYFLTFFISIESDW